MVVRIGCKYSDDWDFSDYEEGERIHIDPDALSVGYGILEDEDDDEAIDGREGELSKSFDYELTTGSSAPSSMASSCLAKTTASLNATSAGEMGREHDGLSPAESAEDAEEMEIIFCCFSERDMRGYDVFSGARH